VRGEAFLGDDEDHFSAGVQRFTEPFREVVAPFQALGDAGGKQYVTLLVEVQGACRTLTNRFTSSLSWELWLMNRSGAVPSVDIPAIMMLEPGCYKSSIDGAATRPRPAEIYFHSQTASVALSSASD